MAKRVDFSPAPYSELSADSFITKLRGIAELEGYSIPRSDLSDHILSIAEANSYNPAADYLRGCLAAWDGQETHVRQKFDEFILDDGCDPEFLYNLFRRWVITAAKMPFNDGTVAAQGLLVLVGAQGVGKTRFLSSLLPVASWGKTGRVIDPRDRDSVLQALGFWIVELGEYGPLGKNADAVKAFATDPTDVLRRPYARNAEQFPRTTVFIATTDKDEFLSDTAGERRNWVIPIKGFRVQNTDLAQFWGEAAHLALVENERHWLTMDEITQLNRKNEAHKVRSAEFEMLFPLLDWDAPREHWVHMTAGEVCTLYGIDARNAVHVGRALTAMLTHGVEKSKNTSVRTYFMPPPKELSLRPYIKQYASSKRTKATALDSIEPL